MNNDTEAIIAFRGEVQLLRWSETSNGGATITLALSDPSDLENFKLMTLKKGQQAGQRLMAVMVELGDDEKPVPVATPAPEGFGHSYVCLFKTGWFNNPRVVRAFNAQDVAPGARPDAIKGAIYTAFAVKSLAEIEPKDFRDWLALPEMRIADTLPRDFA